MHNHAPILTFGTLLKARRRTVGLTQAELAARVSCAVVTVRHCETGRLQPSAGLAERLAEALGLLGNERRRFLRAARARERDGSERARRANSIPEPVIELLGREREIAALSDLLSGGASLRLLTLLGPPGIGKTSLCKQVAYDLRGDFRDGAYWIDLAPIQDAAFVLPAIARTLGVADTPGIPLLESVKAFLRGRELLLVLDNFEHVLSAAADTGALVLAAPRLTVLTTSRIMLHHGEEKVFPVPPLELPEASEQEMAALLRFPSVQLFVERARAVNPALDLTPQNVQTIAAICIRLDGLPLAIELAARRSNLFSPQALLARLTHQLPLLKAKVLDLPERQQTLRAAIDWSYDLLEPEERPLLDRLGVFLGGCTLEAASICFDEPLAPEEVERRLMRLVHQSMVNVTVGGPDGPRFSLLEMLREYALDRLGATSKAETTRQRHFDYFLSLAEAGSMGLRGGEQRRWLAVMHRELDNFRAALTWCVGTAERTEAGLRLAGAIGPFWELAAFNAEGVQWISTLVAQGGAVAPARLIRARNFATWLMCWRGDFAMARPWLEESEALARAVNDREGLAWTLWLWRILFEGTDSARAREIMEECLTLFTELAEPWGIARAQWGLAYVIAWDRTASAADLARARALMTTAEQSLEAMGDRWSLLYPGTCAVALAEGNLEEAYHGYGRCVDLCREVGNVWALLLELDNMGDIAARLGWMDRAIEHYEECYRVSQDMLGARRQYCIVQLADAVLRRGDIERAVALYREFIDYSNRNTFPVGIGTGVNKFIGLALDPRYEEPAARLLLENVTPPERTTALHTYAATLLGALERLFDPETLAAELRFEGVFFEKAGTLQREWDANLAAAREMLGSEMFAAAFAAGKAMMVEQVFEMVMGGRW